MSSYLDHEPTTIHDETSWIDDCLSQILTLVDEDAYHGSEKDLIIDVPSSQGSSPPTHDIERSLVRFEPSRTKKQSGSKQQTRNNQNRSINILAKLSYYSNSRLPANLPPFRAYIPTWPLLCLAAQYSSSVYQQPSTPSSHGTHIPADNRLGTKAMVVKGVCCDDRKTIVFAIRGTSVFSLKDWNVNLSHKPTSPAGFLDDEGNLCHSGFLKVARAMIQPIANQLRALLEQNPSRTACSLLITGHSAGGAVASLIYSHMLSQRVESNLTILASCFKRIHCVTFGAPPISLLPLSKPEGSEVRLQKCLFHSFINEGDPIVRAEPVFLRSLIDLLRTPLPVSDNMKTMSAVCANFNRLDFNILPGICSKQAKRKPSASVTAPTAISPPQKPLWTLPPSTLSNAGRLIILRLSLPQSSKPSTITTTTQQQKLKLEFETVTASVATDDQIRQVVFGDPLMHAMEVYRRRIEALSFRAVTARDC